MARGGTMSDHDLRVIHPDGPAEQEQLLPHAVFGTILFIMAESMMFAGLMSAHAIAATNAPAWPPLDQPRLPIEETLINTAALLVSGVLIWLAGRRFDEDDPTLGRTHFLGAVVLGAFFVAFQGAEWVALINEGLTLTTSQHAGFFYLVVGLHAVHAIGGLGALIALFVRSVRGTLTEGAFWAGRVFWYFVVALWPILYWRVYLQG